jgi:hypothetical protein
MAAWFEINDGVEQFDEWPTDPMRYFRAAD